MRTPESRYWVAWLKILYLLVCIRSINSSNGWMMGHLFTFITGSLLGPRNLVFLDQKLPSSCPFHRISIRSDTPNNHTLWKPIPLKNPYFIVHNELQRLMISHLGLLWRTRLLWKTNEHPINFKHFCWDAESCYNYGFSTPNEFCDLGQWTVRIPFPPYGLVYRTVIQFPSAHDFFGCTWPTRTKERDHTACISEEFIAN